MKIQELPEARRKVILWVVIAVLGGLLFFWWGKNVTESLESASLLEVPKELQESIQRTKEEFIFPTFDEIEIPEEVLQELKEYGQSQGQ